MAQLTNTIDSVDLANANREDLADVIYDISPTETPFVSAVKKTRATNHYHEWLTESLPAPDTNNAALYGDVTDAGDNLGGRTRLGNYVQLLDKVVIVSDDQQMSNPAGVADELAHQTARAMAAIKLDLEAILLSTDSAGQAPSATVPALMRTVPNFITTNVDSNAGTPRAFAENQLKGIIQSIWQAGGNPSMVILSANQQSVAETFSGSSTRYLDASDQEIVTAVDIYTTSFGSVTFVPDRHTAPDKVYVIDPDYWAIAQMGALRTRQLSRVGHAERRLLSWYVTLEARAEASSGKIVDLS